MFNIRELLYDLRQVNTRLAELLNSDTAESALLLKSFVEHFLYGVMPHAQAHLSELNCIANENYTFRAGYGFAIRSPY